MYLLHWVRQLNITFLYYFSKMVELVLFILVSKFRLFLKWIRLTNTQLSINLVLIFAPF